jgi:Protein of unknown function (DUF2441)
MPWGFPEVDGFIQRRALAGLPKGDNPAAETLKMLDYIVKPMKNAERPPPAPINYFHFAPLRLASGSVIQPGNWGRLLKRQQVTQHNNVGMVPWHLTRELVFETIREHGFGKLPSRLGSAFVLPTRHDADIYRSHNDQNHFHILHEVDLVDLTAPVHRGWMSFLDYQGGPFLEATRVQALQYWSGNKGDPEKGEEIVTVSPLKIVKCLE